MQQWFADLVGHHLDAMRVVQISLNWATCTYVSGEHLPSFSQTNNRRRKQTDTTENVHHFFVGVVNILSACAVPPVRVSVSIGLLIKHLKQKNRVSIIAPLTPRRWSIRLRWGECVYPADQHENRLDDDGRVVFASDSYKWILLCVLHSTLSLDSIKE